MDAQAHRILIAVVLLAPSPLSYAAPQHGSEGAAHHHQPHCAPPGHHSADHEGRDAVPGPRVPVAPLTDEDRAAVFIDERGHTAHDDAIVTFILLDQLEWQDSDGSGTYAWDLSGWAGNDIHRLVVRSEGERSAGETEEAELQLLAWRALGPWWNAVAGVRQDFKPGAPQTWAAIGLEGTVLYGLEAEATLYLGEGGQSAARLAAEYDILLTNRLILQPSAEINLYGKNDERRGYGAGLADAELGLRLRYEIRREFAPYLGVTWAKRYGETASFAAATGSDARDTRFVVGFRLWF